MPTDTLPKVAAGYEKYMAVTSRERILIYDIEVFKEDAFVVFMNLDGSVHSIFYNDFTEIMKVVRGATLVSYNGYYYDDNILTGMINQYTPQQLKQLNDDIIVRQKKLYPHREIHSLDCFQQIDVSRPGLKKIEANKGLSIRESPIDFTIDRKLTKAEYEDALSYCIYDVEQTRQIFFDRFEDYFLVKQMIVNMSSDLPPNAYRWNTTTLIANVLTTVPAAKWSTIRVPEEYLDLVPYEIREMWETQDKGKITIKKFDNDFEFGFGGLHSVNTKQKKFTNVILWDVASLYPSIMILFEILGLATPVYAGLKDERIRIKHTDYLRQLALKLILNSTYGLLKQEFSLLFNPKASTTVCAIGQIVLYDLASRLAPTCTIVQCNTDGVAFVPHSDDHKRVFEEWQADYNLVLEETFYKLFIQRDVNNYIAVEENGKIKTKGGDVNLYKQNSWIKPNVARINHLALVNKLVYDRDILDTYMEYMDDPLAWQYILQCGGTYDGTYDLDGNKYNKVNRVFATRNKDDFCVYKKKGESFAKFPNAPSNMFLWNDDVREIEKFNQMIDINHYADLVYKRLEKWEN